MRELSLHILDIVQNSIAAEAKRIELTVTADGKQDLLNIRIKDNGRGMTPEMVEKIRSPFCTTRTTRKVGLGIPMLSAAAEMCEGGVKIISEPGKGTEVDALFKLSHIDRMPFGDITSTMLTLIAANPGISMRYEQAVDGKSFHLDTDEVRRELGDVPIEAAPVLGWIKDYMNQGIAQTGAIP
ncbi:MAG: ATP-binding protein [Armatimonadota bacterium]